MKLCKVVDCHKTDKDGRVIKGLCEGHYARLKKYGDVLAEPKRVGYCDDDKTLRGRLIHGTPENLPASECWEWTKAKHDKGYGLLYFEGRLYRAHRVAYTLASGAEIPKDIVVRHKCDNPPCVNPAHLELGTTADNVRDRAERGRGAPMNGVNNGRAKLTEDAVREIRAKHTAGVLMYKLATEYGVSRFVISSVVRRKTWKHVI